MKIDIQKNWPIITFLSTMIIGAILTYAQMHADMMMISASLDSKFETLQAQIQALQEKEDMRFTFDEQELNEMKSAHVKINQPSV